MSVIFAGPLDTISLEKAYNNAVYDASIVEKGEVVRDLVSINLENKNLVWNDEKTKILVLTWKSKDSYENYLKPYKKTSENDAYVVWVTEVPQVQEFCNGFLQNNPNAIEADLNLRLKQYLGLNNSWNYDVFVEMWVSPDDIFRPCVDPEINDSACNLEFGKKHLLLKEFKIMWFFLKAFISQILE